MSKTPKSSPISWDSDALLKKIVEKSVPSMVKMAVERMECECCKGKNLSFEIEDYSASIAQSIVTCGDCSHQVKLTTPIEIKR